MAQNKVQYQRGLSVLEFFDGYGTPERCEAAVRCAGQPQDVLVGHVPCLRIQEVRASLPWTGAVPV